MTVINAPCEIGMQLLDECSVDAIVTDPPYELGFMGKTWDKSGIANSVEMWRAALRVLRPGGHLLAFSGTRTYHRMVCAIEDAGFEIRDQIGWTYGTGFPKSHNLDGQWHGWGTALKPAWEPIVVARKPLVGTVAENVLAHGTGAINVDGCRVGDEVRYNAPAGNAKNPNTVTGPAQVGGFGMKADSGGTTVAGRWPANLIHDGSDEVLALFPQAKGQQGAVTGDEPNVKTLNVFGEFSDRTSSEPRGDTGSAARFFYCVKASKADRGEGNNHPTVKPVDLMRYLCRLVTPSGGLVLDPFTGSGSTGKAALLEGFRFIGFELSAEYAEVARRRMRP